MKMEFRLGCYLLVLLNCFAIPTTTTSSVEDRFNVTAYVGHLPSDLRDTVATALAIELDDDGQSASVFACHVNSNITCPPSKYRNPTGKCNNIRHSEWGNRGRPFLRLLTPEYADGKSSPRQTVPPLPTPIDVVDAFRHRTEKAHESVTALLGAWSELLLHDLASTGNLKNPDCCTVDANHNECYGHVAIDECKDYMRSIPSFDEDSCKFEHRDQMNLASAYLDASSIYGSTEAAMQRLRTYDAGLVNISNCQPCQTNALYSALLREHNRVAINLAELNRHWPDEILFYESRRIVTAEIQHITYNEYLPLVLGNVATSDSDLKLKTHGHYTNYSSANHAGIYNSIALAALPALISMVPNTLMNETADNFAEMVDILIRSPVQEPTVHMNVKLRLEWDTATLLLHMGRDHGLPGYVRFVEHCREERFDGDFDDFLRYGMEKESVKILRTIYKKPEDVDVLAGVLLETAAPGTLVGPTLSCLLRKQFGLLRRSDRFWYENDLPPSSLTIEQLMEIRKTTIAGLLCSNTYGLNKVQPKAFLQEDPYLNVRLDCEQHTLPQLTPWLEMDHMTDLTEDILMSALSKAEQEVLERRKMEYEVWATTGGIDPKSPGGIAAAFSKANPQALKLANSSLLFEFASNEIVNSLVNRRRKRQLFDNNVLSSVFRDELTDGLQNVDVSSLLPSHALDLDTHCEETGPCDSSSPFRTFTGHCNNLRKPSWGKSLTTFDRLLPSSYEDGISRPRVTGVTGVPLPSPRVISTIIHPDISNLHKRYTLMTMQFAQFLDHDLTMTPIHKGFHESIPNCRSCDSPRTVHPECNPFPVPPGDKFYPEINVTSGERMCFPFMRSLPGQQHLGAREQVNQNTAFLDASQVYGENICVARDLKGFGGRMNCTIHPIKGKDLLPQSDHHPECRAPSGFCFIAGDGRASEQPGLTVIHTIFMREHNRLVDGLRRVNPHWDQEKLFEHARRIVIAQNQHITYNEFLPRLLSLNAVGLYGLKLLPSGYYKGYDPTCNPQIFTEFAAAAFRIGHSLLRPHIPRLSASYQIVNPPILLRDGFFKPDMIMQPNMVDEISRGLISTPMETLDQFITGEVTNHLFEDRRIPFSGIDLIALNIQRARDHGIPSYNNYRALCNLQRATSFEDLSREIPSDVIERLKRLYATVDDIDLFPGGMSERPLQGALIGPTFACIIGTQFRRLRNCDRFWYESGEPTVRFSEAQLAEIRKITLSKIICDNLDDHSDVQREAFDLPTNALNPRLPCRALPAIDLGAWREHTGQGCVIGDRQVAIGESAFPSPCTSCICTSEGGQCASLRVTDCSQLLREWSRDAILRDDVCTGQCGHLLTSGSFVNRAQSSLRTELVPPPGSNRHLRTRQLNSNGRFNSHLNGFKFPDLSPFIL